MEDVIKKEYELALLVENEMADTEIKRFLDSINELKITGTDPARFFQLAFPIKKHVSATLLIYRFLCPPDQIDRIKNHFNLQDYVLRFLLIIASKPAAKANVQKEEVERPAKQLGPEISSTEELAKTLERLS